MGNACTCFESGHWDSHREITQPYVPAKTQLYHDMTQPLPHYFVSSGHNSYLTGNQLTSASGTATIVKCLQDACRVIELDVYNGPSCKHGGTLTAPVAFRACIEAIRDNAFTASPYPVIITMENHADTENQGKMADILKETLGAALFVPDPNDPMSAYKSPEDLKGKIICRTSIKKNAHEEFKKLIYICNSKFSTYADMLKKDKVASSSFAESVLPKVEELGQDDEDEEKETARERAKIEKQAAKSRKRMLAVDEEPDDAVAAGTMTNGSMQELYAYTTKHMMRVYPAGWRVDSGNYNPMAAWVRGASLAALNWQVWDKPLWINSGRFMDNGHCGYVLKPKWMLEPKSELPGRLGSKLRVRVHSAHMYQGRNFCVFRDDLFVRLEIVGMPVDRELAHTNTVMNSGRLVVDKDFDFVVRFPEMAVLLVQLMDEDAGGASTNHADADVLGYYALPLSTLAEGDFCLTMHSPTTGRPMIKHRHGAWVKVSFKWLSHGDTAAEGANPMYAGPAAGAK
ncbi:hypothetical protein HYH03_000581 [Edaphochlamys debaryana]|uniref:Phosphoinositide phospholipase C n=1 Tax=Edaphochlamys debaryana TaxID=47281 RepID=A0A836C7J7_9CHLO|nr:hypothetical protein HYH03_000581 [Edaphochlamys debaryana]|eukprot:KAG2502089.1 hypothetical protein HYH03_000581 [Edaphochlamys debaryana]